jgi:hypothetical protein
MSIRYLFGRKLVNDYLEKQYQISHFGIRTAKKHWGGLSIAVTKEPSPCFISY